MLYPFQLRINISLPHPSPLAEASEGGRVRDGRAHGAGGVRAAPEGAQGHRPVPGQRREVQGGRGALPRRGAQDLRREDDHPPKGG